MNPIDRMTDLLGRAVSWLVPPMVLLVFGLVVARYGLDLGSIAAQEATLWLHAAVFMLGMTVALKHGRHVRVDVLQQRWSPRVRARVEIAGIVLMLWPFAIAMLWWSLDYVAASWAVREASREPGGLPAVYLLKGLIPLSAALLALQGMAELLKAWPNARGGDRRGSSGTPDCGSGFSRDVSPEKIAAEAAPTAGVESVAAERH